MLSLASYLRTPAAWNRRTFLKASAVAAQWPFLSLRSVSAADRKLAFSTDPFQLGVASGDPAPGGVVLWTRLAPQPLEAGGGMPKEDVQVQWRVATDDGMREVVREGTATAAADWAHSVHVEVEGLKPDHVYWYQFTVGDAASPIGRTRTAPASGVMLERFRFAFASCQHWEAGLYTAYEHMAKDDLNLVIHLGDYIYEGKAGTKGVRQHIGQEIESLDDYRLRHSLYKTDPHLQATHHAFPWVVTWDDHEFDNNCAGDISEQAGVDPVKFLERRANAYKAYYEHMPLRKATLPSGPYSKLYRTINYGSLLRFHVLDTRQYRSDQACGDHNVAPCAEVFDQARTMLGTAQEDWLNKELKERRSQWNVLAQQVMVGRVDRNPLPDQIAWSMDQWGGYDAPRKRLLQSLVDHRVSNPMVLTGDIHSNWVNDLKLDFDQPKSATIATEFVGTSISSGGNGAQTNKSTAGVLRDNPFVKFFNVERGYVRCDLDRQHWRSDYQVVEYVDRPGAPLITRASFDVEAGRPGAQKV